MANQSTTGFGLRPIRKVGQTDNNGGLGEWLVAASSAIMYHHDMVQLTADGVILASTNSTPNNLGSLNGVFYTDAATGKPTWANYSKASNTATDIVALVNQDPQQMYEIRTASATPAAASVGGTAPIVATAGSSVTFISGFTMSGTVGTSADQLKLIGISRDPNNQDASVAGCVWRVMIDEHILGNNSAGI